MNTIIFTGGNLEKGFFVGEAIKTADFIIAADQGAKTALQQGCFPTAVIGDLDSLEKKIKNQLQKKGATLIAANPKKDETDTELAVNFAKDHGAKKITILGGTQGNRLDHVLANLLFTARKDIDIKFVNGSQISWMENGPKNIKIPGKKGDLLSLIALTPEVTRVETSNLVYPLSDASLYLGKPMGISNVFGENTVTVKFQKGLLLFIHTSLTK